MVPILLSVAFLLFSPGVHSFCYWIDGTLATGYSPCYALDSVGASMCCDGSDGFKCLDSGLCQSNPYGSLGPYDNGSSYWRAACSDITWQDPACLAMAPWAINGKAQLGLCADGTFCPRDQAGPNSTCCNNGQGLDTSLGSATIAASIVSSIQAAATKTSATLATQSVRSTTTASSRPSTTAATANPSPSPSPQPSKRGWIAGAVLGPAFAVFLVLLAFLWVRRRTRQSSFNQGQVTMYAPTQFPAEAKKPTELEAPHTVELPG